MLLVRHLKTTPNNVCTYIKRHVLMKFQVFCPHTFVSATGRTNNYKINHLIAKEITGSREVAVSKRWKTPTRDPKHGHHARLHVWQKRQDVLFPHFPICLHSSSSYFWPEWASNAALALMQMNFPKFPTNSWNEATCYQRFQSTSNPERLGDIIKSCPCDRIP